MRNIRDDLALAAYAVSRGYSIEAKGFDAQGIPNDDLAFGRDNVTVWNTARGWRVGHLIDGAYERPESGQFFAKLKAALDEGTRVRGRDVAELVLVLTNEGQLYARFCSMARSGAPLTVWAVVVRECVSQLVRAKLYGASTSQETIEATAEALERHYLAHIKEG